MDGENRPPDTLCCLPLVLLYVLYVYLVYGFVRSTSSFFGQVDAEWMTRFHAGVAVPASSLDTDKRQATCSSGKGQQDEASGDLRCVCVCV